MILSLVWFPKTILYFPQSNSDFKNKFGLFKFSQRRSIVTLLAGYGKSIEVHRDKNKNQKINNIF